MIKTVFDYLGDALPSNERRQEIADQERREARLKESQAHLDDVTKDRARRTPAGTAMDFNAAYFKLFGRMPGAAR